VRFLLQCKSRSRVWAEFWWKPDRDEHKCAVYFDDEATLRATGRRVTTCSGCWYVASVLHRGRLTAAVIAGGSAASRSRLGYGTRASVWSVGLR
jgi:hypothetical protein